MFTRVTIEGTLANPDGTQPSGAMQFQLTNPVTGDPASMEDTSPGGIIVLPLLIVGAIVSGVLLANPVGGGGYLPLGLYATDDSTTSPTGLVYVVTEQLSSGSLPPWQLTVSHTAPDLTININSQRPT